MIDNLAGYQSPSQINDPVIRDSLNAFIAQTLKGFSTPGSDVAHLFGDPDIVISGSGLDEYFIGPEAAQEGITGVTSLGTRWEPRIVLSWMRGDIAWAQIRIDGHVLEAGEPAVVPYVATGVFARAGDSWTWLYWGGGEPQTEPRL